MNANKSRLPCVHQIRILLRTSTLVRSYYRNDTVLQALYMFNFTLPNCYLKFVLTGCITVQKEQWEIYIKVKLLHYKQ